MSSLPFRFLLIVLVSGLVGLCSCARLPRQMIADDTPRTLAGARTDRTRVNINTASATELQQLPGIGKALAERIVAHREQNGLFRRPEHLMMVRGISERKFNELSSFIATQ